MFDTGRIVKLRGLPFFIRAGRWEDFWGVTKIFSKNLGGYENIFQNLGGYENISRNLGGYENIFQITVEDTKGDPENPQLIQYS